MFSGRYPAEMHKSEFENFLHDLKAIKEKKGKPVHFNCVQPFLELKIEADEEFVSFDMYIKAKPITLNLVNVSYCLTFKQPQLDELLQELDNITKAFPDSEEAIQRRERALQKFRERLSR